MTYKRATRPWLSGTILLVAVLLSVQSRNVFAQNEGDTSPADGSTGASSLGVAPPLSGSFPENLQPQSQSEPDTVSAQATTPDASASISGVVQDKTGAPVAAAEATLTDADGSPRSTVLSGANGEFTFSPIPPGSYRVVVKAKDLEPFQSAAIVLAARQLYEMPGIS